MFNWKPISEYSLEQQYVLVRWKSANSDEYFHYVAYEVKGNMNNGTWLTSCGQPIAEPDEFCEIIDE